MGVRKFGWNSEWRREYESLTQQLKFDELDGLFEKHSKLIENESHKG